MLTVDNLNQYYGGSHILRNLSFTAEAGKVTAILGRNGVGKSTLLKSLMGLLPAKSGHIGFAGHDLTCAASHQRVKAGIGYVPQGREIFPRLTVQENLLMGLATCPGRTPVPEREEISLLAQHGSSMAIFLSSGMLPELQERLLAGAYTADTPAAIVYKASWPDEMTVRCTLGTLAATGERHGIRKTALILVGDFLGDHYERSKLYDPSFATEFRKSTHAD